MASAGKPRVVPWRLSYALRRPKLYTLQAIPPVARKRLVLTEADVGKRWRSRWPVARVMWQEDRRPRDRKRQRRTKTTHEKGGSLSSAALLAKNLKKRYATAAVTRRRRIAAPVRPKPAISIAQLAGSGMALAIKTDAS